MSELKQCPFCGGNAEQDYRQTRYADVLTLIRCRTCGASSRSYCCTGRNGWDYAEKLAVEAWNRRVDDA